MARLTKAEKCLLAALAAVQFGAILTENLRPAARAMAGRLRMKGFLSKKDRTYARLTQAGYAAAYKAGEHHE